MAGIVQFSPVDIKVENLKGILANILNPLLLSILSGKETQVRDNVFVTLNGPTDIKPSVTDDGNLLITFSVQPHVRIQEFININTNLSGAMIRPDGILLQVTGLVPSVFIEAVS